MQRTNFVIFSLVFASVVLVCVEGKSLSKINYVTELDDFESTDSLEVNINNNYLFRFIKVFPLIN